MTTSILEGVARQPGEWRGEGEEVEGVRLGVIEKGQRRGEGVKPHAEMLTLGCKNSP